MSVEWFDIVVAADEERGIACAGSIPWHIPADLRHFKRITQARTDAEMDNQRATQSAVRVAAGQNAVIMGRVTWQSLPVRVRPLPGRLNIVLSRQAALSLPTEAVRARDLHAALDVCSVDIHKVAQCFVIGGAQIYAEAILHPACRHIFYTRIQSKFACDRFFPELTDEFVLAAVIAEGEHQGLQYCIEKWTNVRFSKLM